MFRTLLTSLATAFMLVSLQAQTVVDVIVNSPNHTTLESLVIQADLATTLSGAGPFTVFAPDDDAFAALPQATLDALAADNDLLRAVLLYHVVAGEITSSDIPSGQTFVNSQRANLSIQILNTPTDGITLNEGVIVDGPDLNASNGVVHSVDGVIFAMTIAQAINNSPNHDTLTVAVNTAGYLGALNNPAVNFTLFAPSDASFRALPAGAIDALLADDDALDETILYHLAGGSITSNLVDGLFFISTANNDYVAQLLGDGMGAVQINNNPVTVGDIVCLNGIVHSIDALLQAPSIADFVDISVIHTTLETAIGVADLRDGLNDRDQQLTLFAPTDVQFARLPAGALDDLIANPDDLEELLAYHVLPDSISAARIADGLSFPLTLAEYSLQVTKDDDSTAIDNRALQNTDLLTTTGIIHVPNAVLSLPNVVDIAVRSPVHNTLVAAVTAADLVTTLNNPDGEFTVFAPTDDAFAGLAAGTLDDLLADPDGFLRTILLYHVLGQEVDSETIIDDNITTATTVQGEEVAISLSNGTVVLNDNVNVIIADIFGTNGVVHAIDGVLIPEAITSVKPTPAGQAGILVAPIPAVDYTQITLPATLAAEANVQIIDGRGQVISLLPITAGVNRIDLSTYSAGMYYLMISANGADYYQSVVVK